MGKKWRSQKAARYDAIIAEIFRRHYRSRTTSFYFDRTELQDAIGALHLSTIRISATLFIPTASEGTFPLAFSKRRTGNSNGR